ncbi:hypothetical protein CR513_51105, partial [Mucuna pruriens]
MSSSGSGEARSSGSGNRGAGSSGNRGAGSRGRGNRGAGSSSSTNRAKPPSGRAGSSNIIQAPISPLEFTLNRDGIPQIILRNPRGATAMAMFSPPKAVRGGIPICFPQFGTRGTLEQHGFARNRIWIIDQNPPPLPWDFTGKVLVDLLLKPSEDDMKIWPHSFEFRLRVSLAAEGNLGLTSRIRNIDEKNFSFSFGYHTYLSVSDISEVRIEGLETLDYLDNLLEKERFTEQGDALTFESEVDRVYIDSDNMVAVLDHQKKRTVVIRKDGLPDVVVWNPWDRKSKAIVDLGDEEYKQMLCVDGAAVFQQITLKPGEEWTGRLDLSILRSS